MAQLVYPQAKMREVASSHGTLILAIPCREGLVVCADRRMRIIGGRNQVLEVVKINQLGSHAAFGLVGNPVFYSPVRPYNELFNAGTVVKRFYSSRDTRRIQETWDQLVPTIQERFSRFLSGLTFEQAPPSGPPPENYLFHLPFWYVNQDGLLGATTISLAYVKERGMSQLFKTDEQPETFELGRAFSWGSIEVFNELKQGNDVRFEDFRNEAGIRRLLREDPPAGEVEVEEAVEVAKRLIEITSENMHLLTPGKQDVGITTNCALISTEEGFKWLDGNDGRREEPQSEVRVNRAKKRKHKKRRR